MAGLLDRLRAWLQPSYYRLLDDTAWLLQGTREGATVAVSVDGVAVRVSLSRTTGGDGNWVDTTRVDAILPVGYPFVLHVRRRKPTDRRKIERGDVLDLALDDKLVVEGAPAAVVREVLDGGLRDLVLARRRAVLVTDHRGIRLTFDEHPSSSHDARGLAETIGRVASRVREVTLAIDGAVPIAIDGAPFRESADDRPLQEARAARAAEAERLRAVIARR